MTRKVTVGNVVVGGGAPVSVQSMSNVPLSDYENIKKQNIYLHNIPNANIPKIGP